MDGKSDMRYLIALMLVVLAVARVFFGGVHDIDLTTLAYLTLAIGLLYIDEFQEFSFGDKGFSFKRRAEKAANELGVGGKPSTSAILPESYKTLEAGNVTPDDPNKNRFGGQSVRNDKRLSANVIPYPGNQQWFVVKLLVESVDPKHPLRGRVTFHLHPTFRKPVVGVEAVAGRAELELVAWGAFTVGAICESDGTQLELDLSELATAPYDFRTR